jgi:glycine dehydrogenase subunit 1
VHLACLGERNFMQIAEVNAANAVMLRDLLLALPGIKLLRTGVHFNEFSIELPLPASEFCARMKRLGVFAGVPLAESLVGHKQGLLIAVTELKSVADLQGYAKHALACLEGV